MYMYHEEIWLFVIINAPGGGGPLDYVAVHTRDQENA